jgi:hypothetical protein
MATIAARPRKHITFGYTAPIRIKRGGKVILSRAQSFDRRGSSLHAMPRTLSVS